MLVLTVVMILAAVLAALALLGGAIGARQRAATAADLGALAAAGALPPSCAVAAGVVAGNGARLVSCTLAGSSAAVVVAVPWRRPPGLPEAFARARAGPPRIVSAGGGVPGGG